MHHRSLRKWHWITIVIVSSLTALGLFAGWRIGRRPRLNVIVVTLDTTRADRLGCYGYRQGLTPVLDSLAKRGVLFENAYTTVPMTLPAHASLFTGLYPPEHGIHTNGKNSLDNDIPTLADACRARGYDTGAFVASFVLDSKFGLDQGFQTYGDLLTGTIPTDEALHRSRDGNVVMDEAMNWLINRTRTPFFCWVHLYDPHSPYLDHQDLFGDRFQDRPYDAEIAFVDVQLGRLVNFLGTQGLVQQTLLIVVGDHGEGLGQHHERRHGQMLYNSTLHVPWIMSLPGTLPAGRRVGDPVSVVDLYPTVIEALQLDAGPPISGRSLLAAAQGQALTSRPLYAETDEPWLESGWSPLRVLISDHRKYIRTPKVELFDLQQDPQETQNLAAEFPDEIHSLERQLTDLESGLQLRVGSAVHLSADERKKLAGLGYLGHAGSIDSQTPGADLHDIKDMLDYYNELEDARHLLDSGKHDEALERLRAIVAAAPDYELAELTLGDVYLRQRKFDEAWDVYHRVVERNPESALAILHQGDVREAQGRYEEALAYYQEALRREPDFAKLHYNIGRVLVILQRGDEAIEYFKTALEFDPGYVFAHIELGSALSRNGFLESALAEYELALKYDARSVFAHMNAAMVLARQGRSAEALAHLEQAADLTPQDPEIQFQLGAFHAQQGRFDQAATHLTEALRLHPDHAPAHDLLKEIRRRTP
jgi:arylsulfatase A-like enzyme/Tfp pilus assembly protein PilF